ncbi:ARM REPEAT PROTEIN INTERACTING WITH ABF2 [Glycine max]|nr:ARM REPEAT PROTEIN INTERACTING WITH ABF2 [Glycine max]
MILKVPAAMALGTLAFQNDDNKNQIVECKALPTLVLMLRSEDITIHCVAVDVIRKLVNSSPNNKKEVLLARDLQPVLCLLRSKQWQPFYYANLQQIQIVHVSQRGAIPLLVDLLKSPNALLQEVSTFALWRLAKDIVADIIKAGGFQTLKGEHFEDQPTKECAGIITLKRLEEKMQGQVQKA